MRKLLAQLDLRDWHFYTGLLLLSIGSGFVYWPLCLIVPGLVLLFMGIRRPA